MAAETFDDGRLLKAATWRHAGQPSEKELARLPLRLANLLRACNGFILFDGMLHVRGVCAVPLWHSLDHVWRGPLALSAGYRSVTAADVPFAQDAFGDQFLLRGSEVWLLAAETDTVSLHSPSLSDFLEFVLTNPTEALNVELPIAPLNGARLAPGQLINVYPPFMFKFEGGYNMRPVPALEQISFLMDIVKQCRDLPEGTKVKFRVVP